MVNVIGSCVSLSTRVRVKESWYDSTGTKIRPFRRPCGGMVRSLVALLAKSLSSCSFALLDFTPSTMAGMASGQIKSAPTP